MATKRPTRKQQATNETTTPERLEELARVSPQLAALVAKHPNAAPELLRELASSANAATRKGVATNPNAPTDVLLKLGEFPGQLLDNPVFPMLLLENPNLLAEVSIARLRTLLKRDVVPESFLEWVARESNDGVVLLTVAIYPNTPKTALEKLTQSQMRQVALAAQLHVNWAGEMIAGWDEAARAAIKTTRLEKDQDIEAQLWALGFIPELFLPVLHPDVRIAIAQNPNTPGHLIEELAKNDVRQSKISLAIAQNPNTPGHLIEQLLGHDCYQVSQFAAYHPNRPLTLRQKDKLNSHWHPQKQFSSTQEAIKRFSNLASSLALYIWITRRGKIDDYQLHELKQRASSMNDTIRSELDHYYNTLKIFLKYVIFDPSISVHREVAQNPNTPLRILEEMVEDKTMNIREAAVENLCENFAYHPDTASKILHQLAKIRDQRVRLAVARNFNTPGSALEQLAKEQHSTIRLVVARNLNTPAQVLEKLVRDENKYVREAAIKNLSQNFVQHFNLPGNILEQFEAVQNPGTSQDALKRLATSKFVLIREGIAIHPNTSSTVLEELAADKNSTLRLGVAQNPNTPGSLLEQLALDKGAQVRLAVAGNPNTPVSLLEQLAKKRTHSHQPLQAAAVKNLISQNPERVAAFLEEYIQPLKPSFSRLLVFFHPQAPSAMLAKNFRSYSWLERYAIAQNPNTPPHILKRLTLDGNRIVRAAAKANLP